MLKKENRKPKLYRIVIIFATLFLLFVEIYVVLINARTVNVSSFDVEVAASKIEINEGKKTFSISSPGGNFIKASKEYKEVLAVSSNNIAVIDTDNQLKIIDVNENVLAVFADFSLDTQYVMSTALSEEQSIIKINFIGNKDGKDFNIDYCYNKDTKETSVIKKF